MEKNSQGLRLKEVCALIKACSEARVSQLKLGDLEILFAPAEMGPARSTNETIAQTDVLASQLAAEVTAKQALEQDERLAKEERLSLMAIEDPAELEKLMLAGELDSASTED